MRSRSQVIRATRAMSHCEPSGNPPLLDGMPLFHPASNAPKLGSSGLSDRVINAYVDGSELVLVIPDSSLISGVKLRRQPARYACFFKLDEISDDLKRMLRESKAVRSLQEENDWLRVCWRDAACCRKYCASLQANGIFSYEGNIDPVTRWMADTKASVVFGRLGYLDLESDSRVPFSKLQEARILSWALVGSDEETAEVLDDDADSSERALLLRLWARLDRIDQVAAWNGDKFDFPLLQARTIRHGISIPWKRWLWLDHMALFERMNAMAAESGDEKQSMALGAICQAVLGETKADLDASRSWDYWVKGGESREKLSLYNLRDALLEKKLEDKTGYIALLGTLAEACGSFPDSRGMLPTVQVENLLQRLAVERGYKFETAAKSKRYSQTVDSQFRGAYVMEPAERGIVKNVHVADFSSLYPTIIRTWNMSGETKKVNRVTPPRVIDDAVRAGRKPWPWDGECVAPITGVVFKTSPEGMLSGAVAEMMRLRKSWNEKKAKATPGTSEWIDADRRSTAYKIAANSCYGAIGMPSFRHHDVDVAESVSQAGVWLIKQTIKAAEEKGLHVLYADTDSAFVRGCTKEEFLEFVKWCNSDLYPHILRLLGCEPGLINLAYEKAFERIVLISKKRYCGRYSHYKGTAATLDSKPEVKGLEYKRGDSIRLARQLQAAVVDLLVGQKNGGVEDSTRYESLLKTWRARVLEQPLELDDVVITKGLSRSVDSYAVRAKKDGSNARQLPHIEVAKILAQRGRDVGEGTRISYVVTNGSTRPITVIPAEDWTGEVDREAAWESLIAPPTIRVLEAAFPEVNWSPLMAAKSVKHDESELSLFSRGSI
jgi:DNA polymerase elongation subunit (family B)